MRQGSLTTNGTDGTFMEITSRDFLRSLVHEAGRQSDFFDRRGQKELSQFWSELEALAFAAQHASTQLHIEVRTL